ncbi:MAG: two-component regulator propeller domain-containing protein [Rikenellaceae bacterium]
MKRFLLIILLAFTLSPCYAYIEKNLKILSMESGMPDNTINRIYRDKNGFMWFATKKGISRYDGSNFKNFALPIKDQLVKNIFGSTENYIWTWGNGHLNCLNTES